MSLEFIEVIIESEKANDELFDLYPKVQLVHSPFHLSQGMTYS